jgi:hypothetical protein
LKEEALNRTVRKTRFGSGYGPVVRQTAKRMDISLGPKKTNLIHQQARYLLRHKCRNVTITQSTENDVQYRFMEKTEMILTVALSNPLGTRDYFLRNYLISEILGTKM